MKKGTEILCKALLILGGLAVVAMVMVFIFGIKGKKESVTTEVTTEATTTEEVTTTEATTELSEEEKEALRREAYIEETLADMTLREKICQMCVLSPQVLTAHTEAVPEEDILCTALKEYPVGGMIYFASDLESRDQTVTMISNAKSYAEEQGNLPMFFSVDEEGGSVARCAQKLGTTSFYDMYYYREEGEETAYENAKTIATDLKELGFNLDYAPVADTWTNPANTVIGSRAYSTDYAESALLVASAVEGFHEGGVACTLKHFPGHGDTAEDSHTGTAYSYRTLEELHEGEYLPFTAGIDAGADLVMVGHITVPEVDDVPATLSKKIITEELRGEMGFEGVVITDDLHMDALAAYGSDADLAYRAVDAGADILLMPRDMDLVIESLTQAVEDGRLSEDRIDESVRRILEVKLNRGIIEL